ncbi:DUF1697 domain-containing protein [Pseudoroseicyclus tamaricis]|uniref:DUF1697 domain-containing protein n=1 Tax=Pseudoroseicyclus tamaricis TaxID=2705421 RepID=A0A6B2JZJ6_9RHOB|nr:DUF1697 domain-containing protein [Pseudoroseicyclus tamaricis]NDV00792.1 DUF1697 domain-containing protein [Pseudoroseicyclus tamaricis]
MAVFVALLRGVNVGGVKVEMARLRALAEGLGWGDVRSYIASGNVVFSAEGDPAELAKALEAAIAAEFGRAVPVLVLTAGEMRKVAQNCPFEVESGNKVHCFFCWETPRIDEARYRELKRESEALQVVGRHVWMLHPEGMAGSRLGERIGRVVEGTELTGRNLNTVRKLAGMVDAGAGA